MGDLWPSREEVAEIVTEGQGFWRSCSGCHETNEGHPTGPIHPVLRCSVGLGCTDCGGIGAVWDTTDYGAMCEELALPAAPTEDVRARALREAAAICDDLIVGYAKHKGAPLALADAKRDILALIPEAKP